MNLTVLFLLEGQMKVHSQGSTTCMQQEDVLLLNPGISYALSDTRDALYGEAVFSSGLLSDFMGGQNRILYADSATDSLTSYRDLRELFRELTAEYTDSAHKSLAAIESLLLKLLDCLIENHQLHEGSVQAGSAGSDPRMQEIMQYVTSHIGGEINLSELADRMYVSVSTLSRIFRKNTGVYFTEYITKLRVQSALGLLEHSDQNLTQIALNCGFSDSSTFSRSFKKVTGMNPSEYRLQKQEDARKRLALQEEEEKSVREELRRKGYQVRKKENVQDILLDDADTGEQPWQNVWGQVINIGGLYELTRANVQFHVLYLQEQLHFSWVRVWNVFSVRLLVSDGRTLGQYNFDGIDQALDFLVQHHLKPFLDLSRRPDTAIRAQGMPVYYRDEYVSFTTRENWERMILAFLSHISERYGQEEVSSWIYELSHDPDHQSRESGVYNDPQYDFFNAWSFLYRALRREIPAAKLGGVSSVPTHDNAFLTDLWKRCSRENCLPDYVSMMLFPYDYPGEDELSSPFKRRVTKDPHFEEHQVEAMRRLMEEYGLLDRKLYITEWNNSISNRNVLNDGCFRSAYLVQKVEELWGRVDLLAIMAGSDWVSSYLDTTGIVNGGIGLLTKDSIRKPAFFAVQFLNQLGKNFIGRGRHYIATRQDNGDLYILCFYFLGFRKNEGVQDENIDLEKSRHLVFEDDRPLKLQITIEHLNREGNFCIKRRYLNGTSGSILDEWGKFQYEKNLTRQDVKYLQEISAPKILLEKRAVGHDHRLEIELTMEPQEISLLHIYPAK